MPGIFSCRTEMNAWRKGMQLFTQRALPNAVANTLNRVAENVRLAAIHNLKSDFTVRTQYTTNSMRVSPAHPHEDLRGYAMVGSMSKYLPIQETGGTSRKPEIPTLKGSRGGAKQNIVPSRLRMKQLAAAMAKGPQRGRRRSKTGRPFMMTLRKGPGIFIRQAGQLLMLRDLSKQSTHVKATHWFSRAIEKFGGFSAMRATFKKELDIQMRRVGTP